MVDAAPASALEAARSVMREGRRVVVMTGAGISTDSGIPDFRGPQGVWTRNPAAERASNLHDYLADPEVRRAAWQNRLRHPAWGARPNAGHLAIVELQRQGRLLAVLTQNIDDLHQRSGIEPDRVVELHGSMHGAVCWTCGWRAPMAELLERVRAGEADPACPECGGVVKSTTISFGQALDPAVLARADAAARGADVLLAVGSTLSVHPAAGFVPVAKRAGARVVIVNGEPTAMDRLADVVVGGSISAVLPELVAAPG
ncbi:MAG TPA: Sir2 family NAD-dependent protein deacetylase [Acidimicrobiales bacterium]|nr:Sir2 family NAD-dependent protein deacetylase [Acidimicrobiales bacterium]